MRSGWMVAGALALATALAPSAARAATTCLIAPPGPRLHVLAACAVPGDQAAASASAPATTHPLLITALLDVPWRADPTRCAWAGHEK
jgi:hypothetical protein